MTGNVLYTIAANCLPIISIIINYQGLGMIRQLQHAFYNKRYTACVLPPPVNFTMYANSFGIHGVSVNTIAEFCEAFSSALASNKPEVIVVNVSSENLVTPMMLPNASLDDYVDL
jgi:acetolactate synthase-1/2/3 large subunit